jgi:hypothetical protein
MKYIYYCTLVFVLVFPIMIACNGTDKDSSDLDVNNEKELTEQERVLKIAKKIAFEEYGDEIKNELPLRATLVGDSLWIVKGTLKQGAEGGTVYIEISRRDYQIKKITHFK